MNNRIVKIAVTIALTAALIVPIWLWMRPSSPEKPPVSAINGETAVRGSLTVAVDRSLLPVAELQSRIFTDHYPQTAVRLTSESAPSPVMRLLRREVGGAIIEGALSRQEDSLLVAKNIPLKRQPIAHNALVLVVNRANQVRKVSIDELKGIFSGKVTDWKSLGGSPGPIVACLDGSDLRARMVLDGILFDRPGQLKATAESDEAKLLARVRNDEHIAAIMTLPAYARALRSGVNGSGIRAVPVSATGGGDPVSASPETVYTGKYPLFTIVYYLYTPFDALATGFGAWLAKEGQKFFERGDMAPYEQPVRTINLK
ncbi:MAG: phosphate-binding protein [Chlorobiaceae bacterium]|nr:phosphate-binding protein [Chlorobiaceae bacterium]